jgi:hypothetical protein
MPAATVNPSLFTTETAKAFGRRSAAIRKIKKEQRLKATADARLATADNTFALIARGQSTVSRAIDAKSEAVRGLLSVEAVKQAETLAKAERNEPGMFKLLVEACDKLFGWSRSDGPNTLVQVNYLNDLAPQPVVSCGVAEPEPVNITSEQTAQTESKA